VATLSYPFTLAPGQNQTWEFLLTADHERGHDGARHLFGQLAGTGEKLLIEKVDRYHQKVFQGVALESPERPVNRAFALAKANIQLLSADYGPNLPPYFLAGVPEYPQLFGCDTEYTVPGAVAAGFVETSKSALLALADYGQRACGRIPHEITTNGRVFHPGNTQETPQFAAACWDFFRWTGDIIFLRRVYPLCKEGIDDYMPAVWGPAGSLYPIGDGMIERHGMGARKLDSTCYLFQALRALRDMAEALEYPDDARRYAGRLSELGRRFEQDWWLEDEQMYADSLHSDGRPQFDGHWTVVLPLQLGMAGPERARRSLERIEREWVNRWGLVHTRAREELVWTLPTGLLALTAFRYGQGDLGLRMLQNIAETASYGALGAFKELIPIGLCFVQLWSAGLYAQGMIEGLLGLQPLAHLHRLSIAPCLPTNWPRARLAALAVGAHTLTLELRPDGLDAEHTAGPEPLDLRYRLPAGGATLEHAIAYGSPPELLVDQEESWLRIAIAPGQRISIQATVDRVYVQAPDRREEPASDGAPAAAPLSDGVTR
jgi:glycogen debranching enzyme